METTMSSRSKIAPQGLKKSVLMEPFEKVGEWASVVADSTSEYVSEGRKYVQENPVRSVAIAAAAGAAVGCLITLAASSRAK